MQIMPTNMHAHTYRCNHASGTEREYLDVAVSHGMTRYGFADHAPYVFRDGYYSGFRMKPELQENYVTTLLALREEYKDKIDVRIGYEAEYYPEFFEDFLSLIRRYPVDYLILGQHFLENEMTGVGSSRVTDDENHLKKYVDQVCEGVKTGVFSYVAHPDLVKFTGSRSIYEKHYGRLIELCKSMDIPLEINLLGVRDHRIYPSDDFFSLVGEIGAKVSIGTDAHSADVAYDEPSFMIALDMIEKHHLIWEKTPLMRKV